MMLKQKSNPKSINLEFVFIFIIFVLSPLEVFLSLGQFGTISKLIGIVLAIIFIIRRLKSNKMSFPYESIFLLIFIFISLNSYFWAYYPETAITRSITLFQLFILYLITFNTFVNKNENFYNNFYKLIIFSGLVISLYVIRNLFSLNSISKLTRISIAEEVDLNQLASFLLSPFFLSFHWVLIKSKKYAIFMLPISFAIILTQSRAALLVLIITIIIYFFLNGIIKTNLSIRQFILGIILFMIAIWIIPNEFFYRIIIILTDKNELMRGSGRNLIWKQAWNYFLSNPIGGVGSGNFFILNRPTHSSLFQIISELGLLGFASISSFLLASFRKTINYKTVNVNIECCLVIALIGMSLTLDIFYQKYLWIIFGIFAAKKYSYR